jgi:hypothetical protein
MGQVVWVVHQATSTRLMQPAPFVISLADWAMIAHMTFIEAGLCTMHILFKQPADLGHLFPLDRLGLNEFIIVKYAVQPHKRDPGSPATVDAERRITE